MELKIVRGNDFYLIIPVRKAVFITNEDGRNVLVEEDFELEDASDLCVNLIDDYDDPHPLEFTLTGSEIIAKVYGCEVENMSYGLEVTGVYIGRCFRSYEKNVFRIVENNGRSFVCGKMFEGEMSYQVDTMTMLYAQPKYAHLSLNVNNMTLEMTGTVENGYLTVDENDKLILVTYGY